MKRLALMFAAATLALAGCSAADTAPDEVAVRYEGGTFDAQTFKRCHGPSVLEYGSPGDRVFTYPVGQRTFKFSLDPGSDSPPLTVTAKGSVELVVSGLITFESNFADCATLRQFHEKIGRKYEAWTPEGWARMLGVYIKDPTDRAIDNAGLGFEWPQLYGNQESKAAWEAAAITAIQGTPESPGLVEQLAGGEFFTIKSIILQKPEVPQALKDALADAERAKIAAEAAETDKLAAANFPGGITAYLAYKQQEAVNKAIAEGKVEVVPIPQGSPVIVAPGGTP